ncbi:MAG: hypothetical protein JWN37_238 [Candidatus Nomurabacteria bacterium]|nr:hypothetical protein [Candidatus Nomurabacteria bacterium]
MSFIFVLFSYTKITMKKSSVFLNKQTSKTVRKSSFKRKGALSKITRSTKRFGKQTLRDILLSKTFHSSFKVLIGLLISGTALYGAYAFIGNTFANDIIVSKSEILARVGKHTDLPQDLPEAVVRVQDPDILKKQQAFYENVKEGDYIIIYPKLAVIYDLRNDSIIALKRTESR